MEFVESPLCTQLLPEYLTDDEYAALQRYLVNGPEAGDVMPGTGGFRKVRWADRRRGQGRRGGLRVIYYLFEQEGQIWFLTLYGKDEAEDLTRNQKRLLKAGIDEEKRQRSRRRPQGRK